jgi:anaerobic ribonucleoside-triphosphate reductase activating protein
MLARYNTIKDFDMHQGDGINVSLWMQGCEHRCKGCYSPQTWDFNTGYVFTDDTIEEIIHLLSKDEGIHKNLSILGGETLSPNKIPYITKLVQEVKSKLPGTKIFLWTGYTWDCIYRLNLMKYIDVVVDGRYDKDQHCPSRYKGSSNQRVIDVQKSLSEGKIVKYE